MDTKKYSNIVEIHLRTTIDTAKRLSDEYNDRAASTSDEYETAYYEGKAEAFRLAAKWTNDTLKECMKEHTSWLTPAPMTPEYHGEHCTLTWFATLPT